MVRSADLPGDSPYRAAPPAEFGAIVEVVDSIFSDSHWLPEWDTPVSPGGVSVYV